MPSLRFAFRRWRSRPGLAVVAIAILALGIGATTAMFSIVNAVLLKDEPWPDADRLVRVYGVLPQQRANSAYATTWNRDPITWQAWREAQKLPMFEDVAAWVPDQQVIGDAQTELVRTFMASSTLPLLLGARPERGRFFSAAEDEADSGTVIISHRLWARLFGSDPDIVGKVTNVTSAGLAAGQHNRRTIVGVLPETFSFPGDEPDILIPIGFHKYNGSFGNPFFRAMGRLRPAATASAAEAAVEPLVRGKEAPDRRTARVVTLRFDRIGFGDRSLWLMFAGAGLLLLVACSNVAGLLLSDARSRQHETAVRLALGGTRGAILRAVMTEHAVLAVAAAASGVLLAAWLIPLLGHLAPPGLIGDQAIALDARIARWAVAASILTILLAGLVPAYAVSAALPGHALKTGGREATRGSRWRHRAVVAAQFGLALVLIVGAGLFGETLLRLGRQSLGFSPEGVITASVARQRPAPRPPISPEERARMLDAMRRMDGEARSIMMLTAEWPSVQALLDRLAALPGVRSVAVADAVPFTSAQAIASSVRGEDQPESDAQPAWIQRVSDRYFDAMGIAILRGRGFEPEDRLSSRRVVISEALERRAFGGHGVGRKIGRGQSAMTVIGVVADVRQRGIADAEVAATLYMPMLNIAVLRQVIVRTTNDAGHFAATVRSTIESLDRPMFVMGTAPLSDLVASTVAVERSRALLSGVYGLVALLLASVGLYGLAARLVAERRREIGIRVALGAAPSDVRRLVMTDAWLIVGIGLIVGVPTAIVGSRFAEGMLYGVTPAAPHVIAVAVGALTIAAITATIVPAWRANRVDPVVVLREE